jgi:exonuclease III
MQFKLVCFNLQGKFSFERLDQLQQSTGASIICFSEANNRIFNDPALFQEGVNHTFGSRYAGIYTHNTPIDSWGVTQTQRITWARSGKLLIVSVYMPTAIRTHEQATRECYEELTGLIANHPRSTLLIGGDFNARIGIAPGTGSRRHVGPHTHGGTNDNTEAFVNFLAEADLTIPSTYMWRKWKHRWTWEMMGGNHYEIDHVVTRAKDRHAFRRVWAQSGIGGPSDHRPIIAEINLQQRPKRRQATSQSNRIPHKLFAASEEKLEEFTEQLATRLPTGNGNAEATLSEGIAAMHQASEYLKETHTETRGILEEAKAEVRARLADLDFGQTRDKHKELLRARRRVDRIKRREERRWTRAQTSAAEKHFVSGNSKALYETLKTINRGSKTTEKKAPRQLRPVVRDGITFSTPEPIAQCLATWLASIVGGTRNRRTLTLDDQPDNPNQIDTAPPQQGEIESAISSLRNRRAGGPDGIINECLKNGGPSIIAWLLQLFSKIWAENMTTPRSLSALTMIMICKPGKSAERVESYRPIGLSSTILKVLETILATRLQPWYRSVLGQYQVGFTRSRQLAEHVATIRILAEQERAAKQEAVAVFLDLSAAYDKVDRSVLYEFLGKMGMPTEILELIRSVHSAAHFVVKVQQAESTPFDMTGGLPQGSPLSPMLFNLFLEGIMRIVIPQWERAGYSGLERGVNPATGNLVWKGTRSHNTTIKVHSLAYADDIVLLARDAAQAKGMLEILHGTLSAAGMEISTTKSAWMRLGTDTIGPQQQLCCTVVNRPTVEK